VATLPTASAVSQKTSARLLEQLATTRIKSIDLNASEDVLIIATENQQIIKIAINIERPADEVDYSYLSMPFHARAINGMDTCIKKPLIATTSMDRTVKVWSYIPG
jgi:cilia- and flagella-associated protein 57